MLGRWRGPEVLGPMWKAVKGMGAAVEKCLHVPEAWGGEMHMAPSGNAGS